MPGILLAGGFMLVYALTSFYFTSALLWTGAYTYEGLVRAVLGRKWEVPFNVINFLLLTIIGLTQTYLIVVALQGCLVSLLGEASLFASKLAAALYICPYLFYYGLRHRVKELRWVSVANILSTILFVIFVVIFSFIAYEPLRARFPFTSFVAPL